MPGQEAAGAVAEAGVVLERDDPAVDLEPPHREREPQRGRAAAAFHDERGPFGDNHVDQHREQVRRRCPAPGGGQQAVGGQHGAEVLQRFQLAEGLLDLLAAVGFESPHGIERALAFRGQVADPARQVEIVPDQQQHGAQQGAQRHQCRRRHRARAGCQPEPERAGQPAGDQRGYRLRADRLQDQSAHGGLPLTGDVLIPYCVTFIRAFMERAAGPWPGRASLGRLSRPA